MLYVLLLVRSGFVVISGTAGSAHEPVASLEIGLMYEFMKEVSAQNG